MDESIFQAEIRESIKYLYPVSHYKKIPDPSKFDVNNTIKRPYDGYFVSRDQFVSFEYKIIKEPISFPFDRVDDNQIYNLLCVAQNFQLALLLINYRFNLSEKQMQKYSVENDKHNFTLCLEIAKFLQLKKLYKHFLFKKSIPFEYIWELYQKKSNLIINWEKIGEQYIWNLKPIIEVRGGL
ncbi:MAG: hypothetical protein PHP92_04125 [Candidatus Nanoarchaeia archaeon]|nr:hypothetical protein [Candidatus Nanoarchaeia archaeon]